MKEAVLVLDKYMEQTDEQVAIELKGDENGLINMQKVEYLTRRQHEIRLCMEKLISVLVDEMDDE